MMKGHLNNLKDIRQKPNLYIKDTSRMSISYTKTNKLITALYMVTDILEDSEPTKLKLRNLGVKILSDTHFFESEKKENLCKGIMSDIKQIMSFLELTTVMEMITEMNANILKKEFTELYKSLDTVLGIQSSKFNEKIIMDFLSEEYQTEEEMLERETSSSSVQKVEMSEVYNEERRNNKKKYNGHYNGQIKRTRIGVQKGGTLLKALSDKISQENLKVSDKKKVKNVRKNSYSKKKSLLKKQRQDEISTIIKDSKNGCTISDIRNKMYGVLKDCSEKTLQRELVKMVKDGVLTKEGEKRWSRYKMITKN